MSWKKNVFSYIMWMIYSLAAGSGLFCIVAFIGSGAGQPLYQSALMSAGVLLLSGLCVFFLNRMLAKILEGRSFDISHVGRAEKTVIILLLAAGAWRRIYCAFPESDVTGYFETARVSAGDAIPRIVHGAEYFYLLLLRGICIMFGNHLSICFLAQAVLQLLTGLALYIGVRRLAGIIPGLTMLTFMMLSGFMVKETLILSPRPMYLLLYGVGLILVSGSIVKNRKIPVLGLLAGLMTGFLLYLDILGITLLPVILSAFYLVPEKSVEESGGSRRRSFLAALAGLATGFLGCTILDSALSGAVWGNILASWGRLYLPEALVMPKLSGSMGNYVELLILFGMLSLGIFSFYCRRRREGISVWCLMGILIVAGICAGCLTVQTPGYDLLYLLLAVLAGTGLSNMVYASEQTEEETVPEEELQPYQENREASGKQTEPQIQYIENPLPLPKKHEKKVLDYDYFVADDDDFDYP